MPTSQPKRKTSPKIKRGKTQTVQNFELCPPLSLPSSGRRRQTYIIKSNPNRSIQPIKEAAEKREIRRRIRSQSLRDADRDAERSPLLGGHVEPAERPEAPPFPHARSPGPPRRHRLPLCSSYLRHRHHQIHRPSQFPPGPLPPVYFRFCSNSMRFTTCK